MKSFSKLASLSVGTFHPLAKWMLCFVLVTAVGSAQPNGLRITSSAFVPDREFPELARYFMEGWNLRDELGFIKQYGDEVKPGATIHVFVRNESPQPVEVKRLRLNGIDLVEHIVPKHKEHRGINVAHFLLNDTATTPPAVREQLENLGAPLWYQARPNPIPAGGFAEVVVRLRRLPKEKRLDVTVEGDGQQPVSARLSSDNPAVFNIAAVNFSERIDRVFLYVRRTDGKEFAVRSVRLDGAEATRLAVRNSRSGFLPLEIPLTKAWDYGSFHHIAVTTADGITAAAVARARDAFFALGMWGYRNHGNTLEERALDTCAAFRDHLFNTHMGMTGGQKKFLESAEGWKTLDEMGLRYMADAPSGETARQPQLYARFLLDEPDAHDYLAVKDLPPERRLGSLAQGIVQRQREWTEKDPRTLCLLNVDLTYKPENWLVYGQLPDIMALDPYYQPRLRDAYLKHPGRFAQFCHPFYVFAASEVARWAGEPHPLHVILNAVSVREENVKFRYGTPEEKRIEFYYALAAGAKGISYWWFTPYGEHRGCGAMEPEAYAMMQELARLNAEARALQPLLAIACPATVAGSKSDSFTSALPVWLMARTIFAGTDTAIVILVNRDHLSDRLGTVYQPIPRARLTFQTPPWMNSVTAFRLSKGNIESVPLTPQGEAFTMQLENIDLTEILVLTANPTLAAKVRQQWEQVLPRLEKVTKRTFEEYAAAANEAQR